MIHLTWWQFLLVIAASGSLGVLIMAIIVGGAIADESMNRAAGRKEDADV